MTHFRFSRIAMVFCLGLVFLHLHFSIGQDITATLPEENVSEPAEPLRIKLSVSEVRLDVVVLDNKGKPVTDLTANDFEVFQNGARQNVLSSVYIDNQSGAVMKPSAARKDVRNSPPIPIATADLKREDTHRSIIFVVDDLSMSFENGNHAKMALRNFVEKQMQPGDMAAILRTGHGNSALQLFLSDKREVLARINAMRMEMVQLPNTDGSHLYRIYDNQLSTISYSLRALKDMPGRKILNVLTATTRLYNSDNSEYNSLFTTYDGRFSRLADDALRAGVVVNFLNISGLENIPSLYDITKLLGERPENLIRVSTGSAISTTTVNLPPLPVPVSNIPPEIYASPGLLSAIETAKQTSVTPQMRMTILAQLVPEVISAAINADPGVNELRKVYKNGRVAVVSRVYFLILGYSSWVINKKNGESYSALSGFLEP